MFVFKINLFPEINITTVLSERIHTNLTVTSRSLRTMGILFYSIDGGSRKEWRIAEKGENGDKLQRMILLRFSDTVKHTHNYIWRQLGVIFVRRT